jgi:hypothetical protein
MKLKHWFITLFIFFTCHTVVSANTTLDKLTQDDGITALKAGDELGFEVLSRAELESVRGEGWPAVILAGGTLVMIAYLHYKWATDPQWIMNNPSARTMWNEIRN